MGWFSRPAQTKWSERLDELHERAIKLVGGYANFGEPSYLEGMRVLLEAYDHEARFHMMGRLLAEYQLTTFLCNRLRAEQWWEERPEALTVAIERPIFILGMVRTGSTALHYLMGANPEMQCLQYWLATHPQPRPPRRTWEDARDFQHAVAELKMMYAAGENLDDIIGLSEEIKREAKLLSKK